MSTPISNIERLNIAFSATQDLDFTKKLILHVSIACSVCGVLWGGFLYSFLGFGLTMLLPLIFVVIVGGAIPISLYVRNHYILVYAQLLSITWIPTLIHWSLGSMNDGGVVIAWSFLGPVGALLFVNKRQSYFWIAQFLVIAFITVLVQPKFSNDAINVTDSFRSTFYLMNFCAPAIIVFGAAYYFVTKLVAQKDLNQSLLLIAKDKNREMRDSISYAKRIQSAIMPTQNQVKSLIPNGFVLYKPKDIVAGDFYWLNEKHNSLYFAACDCTGHGVPGALVSIVCNVALNRSLNEFAIEKPGEILDKTRELVLKEFENSEDEMKEGMDIAMVRMQGNKLMYSGANNPLWIVRHDSLALEEIKGCKQPVGLTNDPIPFRTHETELQSGDCIYVFSDGYPDQFGGPNGKKFKTKAFKDLLVSVHNQPMERQKRIIDATIENWRGGLEQVDDICIIGFKME